MNFVYIHIVLFTVWMLWLERKPRPTLIVSLEAIFLSAFVMIGQNRQAAFQQAKAATAVGCSPYRGLTPGAGRARA